MELPADKPAETGNPILNKVKEITDQVTGKAKKAVKKSPKIMNYSNS